MGKDYWNTRKAIEWLSYNGYFSLKSNLWLEDKLDEIEGKNDGSDEERADIFRYSASVEHVFKDHHNLLSLTAAE